MKVLGGLLAATLLMVGTSASAVSVSGMAIEISKPTDVSNTEPGNDVNIQWFQESTKSVVTMGDIEGLGATELKDGQIVDTFMIFLNRESSNSSSPATVASATFTFDRDILAIFGEEDGSDLLASDYLAQGVTYASISSNRGIENNNNDSFSGGNDLLNLTSSNVLEVELSVTQPGDWVRVAVAPVPLPAGLPLMVAGLLSLGVLRRRTRNA